MTDIMKLADNCANACADVREFLGANAGMDEADGTWIASQQARAALQSAIEALQEENALLEGTLESRERNIAALQAENERLNKNNGLIYVEVLQLRNERNALQAKLDAMGKGEPVVPAAWTNLLAYVLQDDMHNRLTPRVIDIAYTAFTLAKQPNIEDGGASDWFNDTKPHITKLIAKLHKDLAEELDAAPKALAPLTDEQCDQVAAQTMDAVAKARDMHALDLNPNIQEHHTLRRELIRAGFAIGIGG